VPRKNGFAILTIVVVIACVGSWFLWLNRQPIPPSVSGRRQITHDGLVKTNLASDGSILYFTEISGESSIISKVPAAGGDVSKFLSTFTNVQLLDVSTTHSSLLASETRVGPSSENPFWVYPLQGGPAKRFGNLTGQEAVWAPDGQHVLVVKGSSLYITAANGGPARELVSVEGTPYFPRFSPDGKRHPLQRWGYLSEHIFDMGSERRRLRSACAAAGLARCFVEMLRQLDCRWALLHLSGHRERHG